MRGSISKTMYTVFKYDGWNKEIINTFNKEQDAQNYTKYLSDCLKNITDILEQFDIIEQQYILELDSEISFYNEYIDSTILTEIEKDAYMAWIDILVDDLTELETYEMNLRNNFISNIAKYKFDLDIDLIEFDLSESMFIYE